MNRKSRRENDEKHDNNLEPTKTEFTADETSNIAVH